MKGIAPYFLRHREDWGLQRAAEAQWVEVSLELMRIVIDLILFDLIYICVCICVHP